MTIHITTELEAEIRARLEALEALLEATPPAVDPNPDAKDVTDVLAGWAAALEWVLERAGLAPPA